MAFKDKRLNKIDLFLKDFGMMRLRVGLRFEPPIKQDFKIKKASDIYCTNNKEYDLYNLAVYNNFTYCFNKLSFEFRRVLFHKYFLDRTLDKKTKNTYEEFKELYDLTYLEYSKVMKPAMINLYDALVSSHVIAEVDVNDTGQ